LRIVTANQNAFNQRLLKASNTSGYRGVSWLQRDKIWLAYITVNKRQQHLGYFTSPEAAAKAYDDAARKYYSGYSPLNASVLLADANYELFWPCQYCWACSFFLISGCNTAP
jgi:hypothetical protein